MEQLIAEYPVAALFLAGQVGMIGHWLKRYLKEQTILSAVTFFKTYRRAAIGSMLVLSATLIGMVSAGLVEANMQSLATAFLAGFNLNSIFTPHDESKQ